MQYYTPDEDFYKGFMKAAPGPIIINSRRKKIRIHLLLVGNTLEEEIGSSCEKDMNLTDSTFSALPVTRDLEIIKKRITGTDFGKRISMH
ncbi:MAG: hypothetical protein IPP73_04925 [Chitinophagaceae bacterium]|nr:hypothetical protein [Chitinophagaceae bacterium]